MLLIYFLQFIDFFIIGFLTGESAVRDQWDPDAGVLLLLPCDALSHFVLLVLRDGRLLFLRHSRFGAILGPLWRSGALDPPTTLVSQDGEGVHQGCEGPTGQDGASGEGEEVAGCGVEVERFRGFRRRGPSETGLKFCSNFMPENIDHASQMSHGFGQSLFL